MKIVSVATLLLASITVSNTYAQAIVAPIMKEGDSWVYSLTEEKSVNGAMSSSTRKWENSIVRVGSKDMAVASKSTDSNMPPTEKLRNLDWSTVENVGGKLTVVSKPFDFPVAVGKKWEINYVRTNQSPKVKSEKNVVSYTVLGWQDITTPAGTFHALKIEADDEWTQEYNEVAATASSTVAAGQTGSAGLVTANKAYTPPPVSGKTYQVLWYAPEVKTYVKFVYESYQANGLLAKRTTELLDSFKVQ